MTPAERIAEMRGWIEGAGDDEQVQMNVEYLQFLLARLKRAENLLDRYCRRKEFGLREDIAAFLAGAEDESNG